MHTPPPDASDEKPAVTGWSPRIAPPAKPHPSNDEGIKPPKQAPANESDVVPTDAATIDIFTLGPLAALKLLTATVESLLRKGSEAPITPPTSNPNTPRQAHSFPVETSCEDCKQARTRARRQSGSESPSAHHHHDIPHPHKTPIGSPVAHPTEPEHSPTPAFSVNAVSTEPLRPQHTALARKFYSKVPPPIALEAYLRRLHTYCPMSTAVYLAAGLYIQRLTGTCRPHDSPTGSPNLSPSPTPEDPAPFILPITARTAHRLLLASLRVATKALEDLSYPHARFAKVGGVSEKELVRLEISFMFLVDFELIVKSEVMTEVALEMRSIMLENQEEAEAAG